MLHIFAKGPNLLHKVAVNRVNTKIVHQCKGMVESFIQSQLFAKITITEVKVVLYEIVFSVCLRSFNCSPYPDLRIAV